MSWDDAGRRARVHAALATFEQDPRAAFTRLLACVEEDSSPIWLGSVVSDWLDALDHRAAWWRHDERKAVVTRLLARIDETWMAPMTNEHLARLRSLDEGPRTCLARALRFIGEHDGIDFMRGPDSATFWFGLALQLDPADDDALRGYLICVLEQRHFNRAFSLELAAERTTGPRRSRLLLAHAACEHIVVVLDLGEDLASDLGRSVLTAARTARAAGATRQSWQELIASVRGDMLQLDEAWFDQWAATE